MCNVIHFFISFLRATAPISLDTLHNLNLNLCSTRLCATESVGPAPAARHAPLQRTSSQLGIPKPPKVTLPTTTISSLFQRLYARRATIHPSLRLEQGMVDCVGNTSRSLFKKEWSIPFQGVLSHSQFQLQLISPQMLQLPGRSRANELVRTQPMTSPYYTLTTLSPACFLG